MKFKRGVDLSDLDIRMRPALIAAEMVFIAETKRGMTITATNKTLHSPGSYHYYGLAFDIRIWFISRAKLLRIVRKIVYVLSSDFDIVLEKGHIHIEYDLARVESRKHVHQNSGG